VGWCECGDEPLGSVGMELFSLVLYKLETSIVQRLRNVYVVGVTCSCVMYNST
jgi:hypothetical protein